MIVLISDLYKIPDIDDLNLSFNRKDPAFSSIFTVSDRNINKSYLVTKEYLTTLYARNVQQVSINTDRNVLTKIQGVLSSQLITPTGEKPLNELFVVANEYETMNIGSQKKRKIIVLEDILDTNINMVTGDREMLIEYGTVLNTKIMARIKRQINPFQKIYYKDSEEGVLIFVPDIKDFKLKVDLFAVIAGLNVEIYDAKSVTEAIDIYKNKGPKLVVLGNLGESIGSKMVLLELEDYDPYIKKMNYDESPAGNREFETDRIKSNYFSGYGKMLELEKREKEPLPVEIRNSLMETIQKLRIEYSQEAYIEASYALKQFGRMFNVSSLTHILYNLKNKYT